MRLQLDFEFEINDQPVSGEVIAGDLASYKDGLSDIVMEQGRMLLQVDGEGDSGEYEEPLLRLVGQWLRKLQWIITGDTETIAFRNSEQCFAFIPTGGGVEVSLFEGTELEVEEYIIEPVTLRLESFVRASIEMGERMMTIVEAIDPGLFESDEDCRDLKNDLDESKKAWHDFEIHKR